MDVTREMRHYTATGTCPHCGVVILSPAYISKNRLGLILALMDKASTDTRRRYLVPTGAKVRLDVLGIKLQCLTCTKSWLLFNLVPPRNLVLPPALKPPTTNQQPPRVSPVARSLAPGLVKGINVARYRLIGVKDEKEVETVHSRTKKPYSNPSSVKMTHKITVSNSVTRSVAIEHNKSKTSSGQAGVQLIGFANIQGQIQQQLAQKHAVQVQGTFSVSEEVTIELEPFHTIELSITWKMVWLQANALLGMISTPSVEVPYWIPLRLTFDAVPRDVRQIK
jgi:hypothetical protein